MANTAVQQIKERLSIVDVISSYVKLEPSGINFRARCPFHNEKTPSFFVSPERQSFYCFGCGVKGDIFSFIEQFEGLEFKQVLTILAERAHVDLDLSWKNKKESDDKSELYRVMEAATLYFESNLDGATDAKEYLHKRGLTEKTIKEFRLGWANAEWRSLSDHLQKQGFSETILEKAGLVKRGDKGAYDRFRGRIMFPLNDTASRVIAFSGRILVPDEQNAKYLNSPETPLFSKSSVFFGFDRAKESIRKKDYSIIVEGQFDLVLLHQAGFTNVVATSGTAFTGKLSSGNETTHLGIMNRLSHNIVIAFDGDAPGLKACYRASKEALKLGMDVKVLTLPNGKDPADLIHESVLVWENALKSTKRAIFFFAEYIDRSVADLQLKLRKMRETLFPLIHVVPSAVEQEDFLRHVSTLFGVSYESLEKDFKQFASAERTVLHTVPVAPEKEDSLGALDRLFGILFWRESIGDEEHTRTLTTELERIYGAPFLLNEKEKRKENRDPFIFHAEQTYTNTAHLGSDIKRLLKIAERTKLEHDLQDISRRLKHAEDSRGDITPLLEESKRITQKLTSLHQL